MKITTKKFSVLTMVIVLSAMTLHAAPDAKKSTPLKPAPISFTDEQVQKMSKKDVQKLIDKQIQALTPAQLWIVWPNLIGTQTWCPDGAKPNPEFNRCHYGAPALSQYNAILDTQILGLTKDQLLSLPYKQFKMLDSRAVAYVLAHAQ